MTARKKPEIAVDLYAPFARWRTDLLRIEARCFGPWGDNDEGLEEGHKKALFVAIIREGDTAFGYCLVSRRWPDTAYVSYTAIEPEYQNKGHLKTLIDAVETELRVIGYEYLERNARVENGYADKITKFYGSRVVCSYDHPSNLGMLRFFRIRLAKEGTPSLPTSAPSATDTPTA